jgi:hypothetical protein
LSYVRDLLTISGMGLALWGVYQWSIPLACVAGGLSLVACAVLWTVATRKDGGQ